MENEERTEVAEPDDAAQPAGEGDEHSEAPGPHGTGKAYPRGDRPEDKDEDEV